MLSRLFTKKENDPNKEDKSEKNIRPQMIFATEYDKQVKQIIIAAIEQYIELYSESAGRKRAKEYINYVLTLKLSGNQLIQDFYEHTSIKSEKLESSVNLRLMLLNTLFRIVVTDKDIRKEIKKQKEEQRFAVNVSKSSKLEQDVPLEDKDKKIGLFISNEDKNNMLEVKHSILRQKGWGVLPLNQINMNDFRDLIKPVDYQPTAYDRKVKAILTAVTTAYMNKEFTSKGKKRAAAYLKRIENLWASGPDLLQAILNDIASVNPRPLGTSKELRALLRNALFGMVMGSEQKPEIIIMNKAKEIANRENARLQAIYSSSISKMSGGYPPPPPAKIHAEECFLMAKEELIKEKISSGNLPVIDLAKFGVTDLSSNANDNNQLDTEKSKRYS